MELPILLLYDSLKDGNFKNGIKGHARLWIMEARIVKEPKGASLTRDVVKDTKIGNRTCPEIQRH
jgi:hypothetical protein